MVNPASLEDFESIDIRVGNIVEALPFPEGKYSTHVLKIDFGDKLGMRKSLAKLAPNYACQELVDRQVLCVVNFVPRQIGKHMSEVLTLGVTDDIGNVVLIGPDNRVPAGNRLF